MEVLMRFLELKEEDCQQRSQIATHIQVCFFDREQVLRKRSLD